MKHFLGVQLQHAHWLPIVLCVCSVLIGGLSYLLSLQGVDPSAARAGMAISLGLVLPGVHGVSWQLHRVPFLVGAALVAVTTYIVSNPFEGLLAAL